MSRLSMMRAQKEPAERRKQAVDVFSPIDPDPAKNFGWPWGTSRINMADADGDGRAEKSQVIFKTGGNAEHDHNIHAFMFGPDGKFYFNFGNEGGVLMHPDGTRSWFGTGVFESNSLPSIMSC